MSDLGTFAGQAAHYVGVRARLGVVPTKPPRVRRPPVAAAPLVWPPYVEPAPYDVCEYLPMGHQTARDIIAEVASRHGMLARDILGVHRSKPVVLARQEAMWRVHRDRPEISFPQLGRLFDRDHSTVIHGIRSHEERRRKVIGGMETP